MAGCLAVATLVLGCIGFLCMCISTGTVAWKEDINYDRGTKVHIGLWRACIESEPDDVNGIPEIDLECDKDFLRPHLIEPPRIKENPSSLHILQSVSVDFGKSSKTWFNSVRALMLLSCIGTGSGIFFFLVAFITDNSKKTGSKYFPSTLIIFIGGLCALIGLCIFTVNRGAGIQFSLADDKFFANYWDDIQGTADDNEAELEIWLRHSYIVGWFGVAFTCFALITAFLSDLTRDQYRAIPIRS